MFQFDRELDKTNPYPTCIVHALYTNRVRNMSNTDTGPNLMCPYFIANGI